MILWYNMRSQERLVATRVEDIKKPGEGVNLVDRDHCENFGRWRGGYGERKTSFRGTDKSGITI